MNGAQKGQQGSLGGGRWACWAILALLFWGFQDGLGGRSAVLQTRNVVLVTADGLRYQELFGGVDATLLDHPREAGIPDPEALRRRFWRESGKDRRQLLLPFFWSQLAPQGVVLGHREAGSSVVVRNPYRVSYPGYAEILTGQPLAEIQGNDPVQIPRETVLEFVRRKLGLPATGVAAFASWSLFESIVVHRPGSIVSNAGYQPFPLSPAAAKLQLLDRLQSRMLTPWDSVRHDAVTAGFALEYLKAYRPRVLYVALGETDDWAHDGRYDRVVTSIGLFDDFLRELWETLQSLDSHRGRTTLILTSDHGRGRTLEDWTDHGREVPGAEFIWLAVIGPDTPPRGEVSPAPPASQSQVAATLLHLLGLDYREFNPEAEAPLEVAFRRGSEGGGEE